MKPPGLTPRGTATRTAGVSSMPTNFLEHQRAPGNGVVDHGAMPAGLLRAMPMRHWMARHADRQLAGARLGALTFGPFNSEVQRLGLLSYARIFFI